MGFDSSEKREEIEKAIEEYEGKFGDDSFWPFIILLMIFAICSGWNNPSLEETKENEKEGL